MQSFGEINTNTTVQYSKEAKENYSTVQYSDEKAIEMFKGMSDVIPDDGFYPFYSRKLKELGGKKFVWLANRARKTSDTPAKLFCWMLKNSEKVR